MNTRIQISVLLLILGTFLAFIPQKRTPSFTVKPRELALWAACDSSSISVDQVARLINNEEIPVTIVDVRSTEDFRKCNLPGSVNIPLSKLPDEEYVDILNQRTGKVIFYSNGDDASAAALTIAAGLGYKNIYQIKGGLNEWYVTIMNTSYSGERITARENALFANRYDARKLFTEYNSLPDSIKPRIFKFKQAEKAKLDGGCE
jgi:rhodanese-related sulfurtransferase